MTYPSDYTRLRDYHRKVFRRRLNSALIAIESIANRRFVLEDDDVWAIEAQATVIMEACDWMIHKLEDEEEAKEREALEEDRKETQAQSTEEHDEQDLRQVAKNKLRALEDEITKLNEELAMTEFEAAA
jgi:hypothetical protein